MNLACNLRKEIDMSKAMLQSKTNNSGDNYLSVYLHEIDQIPLLNREEEYELAIKAKEGDLLARNRLVESNLRFVVSIAKQYQNRGLALLDLINEGNIGLMTAVDKFDADKGYHFISYAVWWIRQSILKAIGDKVRLIRLPMNKSADLLNIQKAKNEIERSGIEPTVEQISEKCNLSKNDVTSLLKYNNEISSLDAPVGNGSETKFGDFIESDLPEVEDYIFDDSLKSSMNKVLNKLSDKEKNIIELRFGLNGNYQMSLKEIGELYNLTKERIRQIEKKVLNNLSKDEDFKELEVFLA